MSAAGVPLPGGGHIADGHLDELGLCGCPCDECTTRTAKLCVCQDCVCDPGDPEAPEHYPYWADDDG